MKKDVWRGQNSVRFIYYTYKDTSYFSFLVFAVTILVVLLIILNIIIPQFQNWFSIQDESIATRDRVAILNSNISLMSSLNKDTLENKRKLVLAALPAEKDFGEIINAVSVSSLRSGVSVDDFAFGLGPIASTSGIKAKGGTDIDSIALTLMIKGNIDSVKSFIKEMQEKVPLSEVVSVDSGSGGGTTTLSYLFYSKIYRPLKAPIDQPIPPISTDNTAMLNTLSKWNSDIGTSLDQSPPPPSSSVPLF